MFERRIFQNFWEKDVDDQDRKEIGQPVKNPILKKDVINLVFGVFSKSFDLLQEYSFRKPMNNSGDYQQH